mgnify:CR=1 FL=1
MPNEIKMNVSLKDTTAIVCEECGGEVFIEGLMLRKVSRFMTGTLNDAIMPLNIFMCANCHHVNAQFMPKDVLDNGDRKE